MMFILIALLMPAFAGNASKPTIDWRNPDWEKIVTDAAGTCQASIRSRHDMVKIIDVEQNLGNAAARELLEMARTTLPDAERKLHIELADGLTEAEARQLSIAFQAARNGYASLAADIGNRTLMLELDKTRYGSTRRVHGRYRNRLVVDCVGHVVNGIRLGTVAVEVHERLMAVLLDETSSVVKPILARKENSQASPVDMSGVTRSQNGVRIGPNP